MPRASSADKHGPSCSPSARGTKASTRGGSRGSDDTTARSSASTRGGHNEAASACTSTTRHAADATSTADTALGRLLGDRG